ncbi:DEKNAAC104703 [Brettanomyces naardenensis]|uniref:Protoporphyrinogen oxidase n=1 Tax=Brettanomyces naardenensis TaxID=13370 RepID=A0A448YR02_BRENA|nr:DEKNAAC104703 [Brettanomyces naardenensis]
MSLVSTLPSTVQDANVGVIGGGISGLSFAYFLGKLKPNYRIKVFEQSDRTGGYIYSQPTQVPDAKSTVLEKGPRTLRGVSEGTLIMLDLLDKFQLQNTIMGVHKNAPANKKYLLSPSSKKLVQVPDSFSSLVRFISDPLGRSLPVAMGREFFTIHRGTGKEETMDQFFSRHFGKGLCDNILSAVMHGIYAADVSTLSVKAVMPRMVEIEHKSASIGRYAVLKALFGSSSKEKSDKPQLSTSLAKYQELFSPRLDLGKTSKFLSSFPMTVLKGGLGGLPKAIADNLPPNVEVVYNSDITSLEPSSTGKVKITYKDGSEEFDHVRSTINVQKLGSFIKSPELKEVFSKVPYSSVVLANVYVPQKNILPVSGFGFLVPKASVDESKLLGVIFDSEVEHSARPLFTEAVKKELTSSEVTSPERYKQLGDEVLASDPVITRPYTKVTFMLGGYMYDNENEFPTSTEIKNIVENTFNNIIKSPISDYHIEVGSARDAIPQYNVGYLDLKDQAWKLSKSQFNGALSFGGMTFADGVGVPDCVMSSFKDATKLAGL